MSCQVLWNLVQEQYELFSCFLCFIMLIDISLCVMFDFKGSQRKERKSTGMTSGLKGKRCRADSSDSAINSTNNGATSSKVKKHQSVTF